MKGDREEIEEISSMRQVKELLAQMRNSYRKLKQDGANILKAENVLGDKAASQEGGLKRGNTVNVGDGVGDIEELGEFGLGVDPRDSRPVHKIEMSKEKEAELLEAQRFEEYPPSTAGSGIEDPGEDIHASGLKRKTPKRKYMDK